MIYHVPEHDLNHVLKYDHRLENFPVCFMYTSLIFKTNVSKKRMNKLKLRKNNNLITYSDHKNEINHVLEHDLQIMFWSMICKSCIENERF